MALADPPGLGEEPRRLALVAPPPFRTTLEQVEPARPESPLQIGHEGDGFGSQDLGAATRLVTSDRDRVGHMSPVAESLQDIGAAARSVWAAWRSYGTPAPSRTCLADPVGGSQPPTSSRAWGPLPHAGPSLVGEVAEA